MHARTIQHPKQCRLPAAMVTSNTHKCSLTECYHTRKIQWLRAFRNAEPSYSDWYVIHMDFLPKELGGLALSKTQERFFIQIVGFSVHELDDSIHVWKYSLSVN